MLQFTNERDVIVGHVRIVDLTEDNLTIDQFFFSAVNIWECQGSVEIGIMRHAVGNFKKASFVCPGCKNTKSVLYFVRAFWRCRDCHDLIYRNQRLSATQKLIFERMLLTTTIAMEEQSATARQTAKRRKKALDKALGEEASDLPAQLCYNVSARWLRYTDPPKTSVSPDDIHYGWHRRQDRGFRKFRD